jgi:hypothetical protein
MMLCDLCSDFRLPALSCTLTTTSSFFSAEDIESATALFSDEPLSSGLSMCAARLADKIARAKTAPIRMPFAFNGHREI